MRSVTRSALAGIPRRSRGNVECCGGEVGVPEGIRKEVERPSDESRSVVD